MFGNKLRVFKVGGCVRDAIMGIPADQIKDIDFSVEAANFQEMVSELDNMGFTVFKLDPQFFTLRARFPKENKWEDWLTNSGHSPRLTADFVLCRSETGYSDNRRPDSVKSGSLLDDLERRDFTVNAMAESVSDGKLIDPFCGKRDALNGVLRFVGNPHDRVNEDGLRVLRGLRFMVTKGLTPDRWTREILASDFSKEALAAQNGERVLEEVTKMFKFDTTESLRVLSEFTMLDFIFGENFKKFQIWLKPTNASR